MNARKILAAVLIFAIMCPVISLAAPASSDFTDLEPNRWYQAAFDFVIGNGLMVGVGDGKMEPDREITRAEFVTVLCRLFETYNQADISQYVDVPADAWYTDFLALGVQMGIIKGTSETTLDPMGHLTREQAWTILARIMDLPYGAPSVAEKYLDNAEISEWAVGMASSMTTQGRLQGYLDGLVRPKQNITRAETAQLLMRCFPHLRRGNISDEVFTDNLLLLPTGEQITLQGVNIKATLILSAGLADGVVDLKNTNVGRLVCWGARDVYIYPGCRLDEITISRTDGPCYIHWLGDPANLPDCFFGSNPDYSSQVLDKDGNVLWPSEEFYDPEVPLEEKPEITKSHPVYVYRARAYFYPQNDGSTASIRQYLGEDGRVDPVDVPAWDGHVFAGWYYDMDFSTRFDFSHAVADGTCLYGRWYTEAEWAIIEGLGAQAEAGTIHISCDDAMMAFVGEDFLRCKVQNHADSHQDAVLTVVDTETGVAITEPLPLRIGLSVVRLPLATAPAAGEHAVRAVFANAAGQELLVLECTLYMNGI